MQNEDEGLKVSEVTLQLKVARKRGTAHVYHVELDSLDLEKLKSALPHLFDLAKEFVRDEEVHVDGLKVIASEISSIKDPLIEHLCGRLPIREIPCVSEPIDIESLPIPEPEKPIEPELILGSEIDILPQPQTKRPKKKKSDESTVDSDASTSQRAD